MPRGGREAFDDRTHSTGAVAEALSDGMPGTLGVLTRGIANLRGL